MGVCVGGVGISTSLKAAGGRADNDLIVTRACRLGSPHCTFLLRACLSDLL